MTSQWGQLPLVLECLIPVPAFQNFHSSGVPARFCAAFSVRDDRRVSPGFGSSRTGVCLDLHRVLEDWNSALDERSPHALIWDVLTGISWHILAIFLFCASRFCGLYDIVYLMCVTCLTMTEITVCRQHLEQGMLCFPGIQALP